jgi:dipeptidyl aminopeptidase/acylaminoacyl peptidase
VLKPESLLALRFVRDAQLSPDGQWAACAVSRTTADEEFCEIWVEHLDTGERAVVFDGPAFAASPRWSPDGSTLAFVLEAGVRVYDRASGKTRSVTSSGWGAAGAPAWSPDGRSLVVCTLRPRPPKPVRHITRREFRMEGLGFIDDFEHAVVVIDLASGATRTLIDGAGPYLRPSVSPCGGRVMFLANPIDMPSFSPHIFVVPFEGGEPVCVAGEGWFVENAGWTPDGERIVVLGDFESAITVPVGKLWVIGADGSAPELRTPGIVGHVGLRAHHDMPIWGIEANALAFDGGDAIVCIQSRGRCGIWRVALDGEHRQEQLVGGDRTCILSNGLPGGGGRLLFIATDMMRPTDLFTSDLTGSNERQLTDLNSAVMADWPAMRTEHLQFASSDGLALEGWCVWRRDLAGPQPTVLYIHGGPFLGQGHYFRFDTHLLAAGGISVLFSNFRGSAGYGEAFSEAIVGDWGSRGFPDHMAAVDAAIAAGLADPDKLGVWGHSHGGFATCWIVGHTDRFAAAVAEAAVTDFSTIYYLSDLPDGFTRDLGGAKPCELPDVYRSRSPITYAHRCRTPTRLIHDEKDLRCTMAEAEQFFRALLDAGCESDLVILAGCNHLGDAMGPVPARVGQNDALLDWFVRWLKPATEPGLSARG